MFLEYGFGAEQQCSYVDNSERNLGVRVTYRNIGCHQMVPFVYFKRWWQLLTPRAVCTQPLKPLQCFVAGPRQELHRILLGGALAWTWDKHHLFRTALGNQGPPSYGSNSPLVNEALNFHVERN